MLILDQPEKSFQGFKDLIKNFNFFKMLMSAIQNKMIPDILINDILPIWKNQTIIQAKLYKVSKCGCLLAQWINLLVEYNLKKETINSSKRREPELDKKIKSASLSIIDLEKEKIMIQEIIEKKKSEIETKIEMAHEEFTEKFRLIGQGNGEPELLMRHDKEIKGILSSSNSNIEKSFEFPDFKNKDLYGENSVKHIEHQISYEGKFEDAGCCRIKFFCF